MLDAGGYSLLEAKAEAFCSSIDEVTATKKKKKSKNKRRFDDDQIKSLEVIFENESRLEPRKKVELAEELGLQPRQVAIWFQNKRARWKSKQLEQDYNNLQGNYNSLASSFEDLKNEKQALQNQVQKLKDMLQEPREENQHSGECVAATNSTDAESENGETERCESEVQPTERSEHVLGVLSDDDFAVKAEYFEQEDKPHLINMVERLNDGSLASTQDWGCFDTDSLFDQSSNSYLWWDFWS